MLSGESHGLQATRPTSIVSARVINNFSTKDKPMTGSAMSFAFDFGKFYMLQTVLLSKNKKFFPNFLII
jgi:hypothetical protein